MMLQLNPTLPIIRVSDGMKGYAFLVIDYSQEHDLLYVCAMDNGEIWTLNNKNIRIQNNISLPCLPFHHKGFVIVVFLVLVLHDTQETTILEERTFQVVQRFVVYCDHNAYAFLQLLCIHQFEFDPFSAKDGT